jgi:hypothetical protein
MSQWTVGERGQIRESKEKQRMNHVPSFKVDDSMNEGQKNMVNAYNQMRQMLLDNDLMKKK